VALAKQLKHEHELGGELGLRDDELVFYDAICQNDSAVLEMGDDVLKKIARELVDSVRKNARSTGTRRRRYALACARRSGAN
jgi:type I restriction enzyme, R subunit